MSLNISNPFCSTEIVFYNSPEMQERIISDSFSKDIVLVMSKNGSSRWDLMPFIQKLEEVASSFIWISDVPSNPTPSAIHSSLNQINLKSVEFLIAIGGGSCIDLAKGISAFYSQQEILSSESILSKLQDKSYSSCKGIDIIAVPTTAGTGSEVTQWATVWDLIHCEKYSLDSSQLKPKVAFIVPELTCSLSKTLTLSTGLDALSHAMEAYWSKFTTPLVQDIAYRAIELIIENLKQVLENPTNILLRERLCRASLLSGLAFSHTRTTACHAVSYPLTMIYEIPHGFAVALTLSKVAEYNRGYFQNSDELFDIFSDYGGIQEWLDSVCEGIVSLRLSSFGVDDLHKIAEMACENGRMTNNPITLTKEQVEKILCSMRDG